MTSEGPCSLSFTAGDRAVCASNEPHPSIWTTISKGANLDHWIVTERDSAAELLDRPETRNAGRPAAFRGKAGIVIPTRGPVANKDLQQRGSMTDLVFKTSSSSLRTFHEGV